MRIKKTTERLQKERNRRRENRQQELRGDEENRGEEKNEKEWWTQVKVTLRGHKQTIDTKDTLLVKNKEKEIESINKKNMDEIKKNNNRKH